MSNYYHGLIVKPDCHKCPLQHDRKVYPDGPIPARLAIVGEGPGRDEVEDGYGFVGPSGKLLWYLAGCKGIKREDVWVTNAALCMPRDVRLATGAVLPRGRVLQLSAQACYKRLIGELLHVTRNEPNAVIVPVGNVPLYSLTKRKGSKIFAYRGSRQSVDLQLLWNDIHRNPHVLVW